MKSNKLFLCISILLIVQLNILIAQPDTIKKGAYLNHVAFNNNSPFIECNFIIKKQNKGSGYDIYQVYQDSLKVNSRVIKKQIWGIYDGKILYLNCYKILKVKGYTRIAELGQYLYFTVPPPIITYNEKQKIGVTIGLLSVATGNYPSPGFGRPLHKRVSDKTNFILNVKSGVTHELNKAYLKKILETEQGLSDQFNQEKDQDNIFVLVKYIKLLNERF